MLTSPADADGILLDLRYPSVDDSPGRGRAGRPRAGIFALSMLAASLAGCARGGEPAAFAVPRAAAAQIRMTCPPDTFVGTMTANCPQPLSRAAPAR